MIRPDLLKEVYQALGSHRYLSVEDFAPAEYQNREGQPCLNVEYRYDPEMFFKFHIPNRKTSRDGLEAYWFHCTLRPGRESVEESLFARDRDGLVSELKAWIIRLYDDVVSVPAVRQFEEHARAIDQLTERLSILPDDVLSTEEAREFSDRLEQLKSDISAELKQHATDKDELKQQIQELTNDIEFLKRTLDSMTRRQWGELFTTRVQRWKERFTLRQLSAGARIVKLLTPGAGAETLDSVAEAIDGIADAMESTPPPPAPSE